MRGIESRASDRSKRVSTDGSGATYCLNAMFSTMTSRALDRLGIGQPGQNWRGNTGPLFWRQLFAVFGGVCGGSGTQMVGSTTTWSLMYLVPSRSISPRLDMEPTKFVFAQHGKT